MGARVDAHGGFDEIIGRGSHDVREKLLRISIIEREPRALHLDLDAMALEKRVICGVQTKTVFLDFVSRDGFRVFKAAAVTAAKDFSVDHELITGHFSTSRV